LAALAGLARHDGLTGIPNRRTWDGELLVADAGWGQMEWSPVQHLLEQGLVGTVARVGRVGRVRPPVMA
jgi:hypothetical protein